MPSRPFQPLAGIRILDLSRVLAGPVCSMVLADLGADVIKVEQTGRGDDTREWGPPFIDEPAELAGMSAYFASVNRNKRSIALDLAKSAGRDLLVRLIERSDVLLENFLPAVAAKFGLTPDDLHAINPQLIVCSISGFGRTGPSRDQPGYDFVVQALSGLMSITGEPAGEPMKIGVALTDVLTGLYAAVSVLAALRVESRGLGLESRNESGADCPQPSTLNPQRFRHLDLSLLDCTLASLVNVAQAFLVTGQRPARYGNAHPHIVPYECFATADGHLVLAVGNDEQWQRFCAAAGRTALGADARFATNRLRVKNRVELVAEVKKTLTSIQTAEWTRRLTAAEVPHAPVLALDEVFSHTQIQARNMVVQTPDGLKLVASPIKCDGFDSLPTKSPPRLGEHTDEILAESGYTADAIRQLRVDGVVG